MPIVVRSVAFDGSRAIAVTSCPPCRNRRATWPPMNPVPPVMKNRMGGSRNSGDDHRFLRSACQGYGAVFSGPGNGISHWAHMERYDIPGETMLGCDSHTPHAGACGMLAFGAGGFGVANAMAGQPYHVTMP